VFGFQQCCDADAYAQLGASCLNNLNFCWNDLRPVGAIALNALMPHGLASFNHTLLLLFSLFLIATELGFTLKSKVSRVLIFKASIAFILLELMFIGLASVNLTDISAGIFAALAILGFARKNTLLLTIAGGISVLIRSAYLYPMLILVVWFLFEMSYKRQYCKSLLVVLFFVIIAPQFLLTYQHTGVFSFLDPSVIEYWRNFHLISNWYGCDGIVLPLSTHPYKKFSLIPWESSLLDLTTAYKQKEWKDIFYLLLGRLDFYFSSFVLWNKVYLSSLNERLFSPVVMVLNIIIFIISSLYWMKKNILWRIWFSLSPIIAQSLLIIPEQRFIFVIQLFLILFTYLYFMELGNNI
jgi:hypothetical protein